MYTDDFHPYYRNSWALVIGINDYQHASPLTYAGNDAESVASILVSTLGFPQDRVKLIKDRDATKSAILDAYLNYVHAADSLDDRLLFFFAGHGITLEGYHGPVGYLLSVDGDPEKPSSLIRWDDLTRNADLIPAKHILFILDACFSGLALKRAIYPGVQRFLSEMLQRRSRQVITAGKADEVVADGGGADGRNSIFTGYLLEGLSDPTLRREGILTANGLMHYVYEKVAQDSHSQQTPHYGHVDGDGDFVLIAPEGTLHGRLEEDVIVKTSPEMPEALLPTAPSILESKLESKPSFAGANGYLLPSRPNFGRNPYSEKLGAFQFNGNREQVKAFSWLAIVVEPIGNPGPTVNIAQVAKRYLNYSPQDTEPYQRFIPPREVMTTINSVVLFDALEHKSTYWATFVRIEKGGNLEYCDSVHSFLTYKDMMVFRYVQIIGMIWQFMFFGKSILTDSGYQSGARILVNMIGTKDTILADFAKEPGKGNQHWLEPGETGYLVDGAKLLELKCPDQNLQMEYKLVLANLNDQSSREVIMDIATQLGLAYNHQSEQRCFNFGTDVFPWQQFFIKR